MIKNSKQFNTRQAGFLKAIEQKFGVNTKTLKIGHLYMFSYHSKMYDEGTLPYYDSTPISLIISIAHDRFLGLNISYLPPKTRKLFLQKILLRNTSAIRRHQPIRLDYGMLKGMNDAFYKEGLAIIKCYLMNRVKTKFVLMSASVESIIGLYEGDYAHWIDATSAQVWDDTKAKIRKLYQNVQTPNKKPPLTKIAQQVQNQMEKNRERYSGKRLIRKGGASKYK